MGRRGTGSRRINTMSESLQLILGPLSISHRGSDKSEFRSLVRNSGG